MLFGWITIKIECIQNVCEFGALHAGYYGGVLSIGENKGWEKI